MKRHCENPAAKAIFNKFITIILFLVTLHSTKAQAQLDSVYWNFGTSGNASAMAAASSNTEVPAISCLADTGNACCAFGSASGYSTLYFTTQFPSSGYAGASGEPTMRNNAKTGAFNATTSTYFSFTIIPNANTSVAIKEIYFAGLKNATGPTGYTIRTSIDAYAATVGTGSFSTTYGSKKVHTGLSLQGTAGTPITVRIYTHNPVVTGVGGNVFIDDVAVYYQATTVIPPGVSIGSINSASLCTGTNINVPYTTAGIFNSGNAFIAQLSDATGSFTSPVNIGSVISAGSGNITATIPSATTPGAGYRIRIVSTNPVVTGSDNGNNINIDATVIPAVTITPTPGSTICAGSAASFAATIANGGSNPTYQWKKNSGNVGSNSNTYVDNGLLNGDVIAVELTSNAACATPAVVIAAAINMVVNVLLTPSVNITASTSSAICHDEAVTFTAARINGGTNPVYQWKKNGLNVGANNDTYTDNTWVNGDAITLEMASSLACVTTANVVSNTIVMNVNPTIVPGVSITAQPSSIICDGQMVTFVASPVNGGTAPVYQWKINGNNVGANSNTYSSNSLSDGNMITVDILSNATCAVSTPVQSNAVKMNVEPTTPPAALLTVQPADTIIPGQTLTFTLYIADGGGSPIIHWLKNGTEINGATGYTYVTNSLGNGDEIKCFVESSNICATPDTTNSNAYVIKYIGTGIDESKSPVQLKLYPNPNHGIFTVDEELHNSKNIRIDIYNSLGQLIHHTVPAVTNGNIHEQLNLSSIPSGTYWLNLRTDDVSKTLHFIIQ